MRKFQLVPLAALATTLVLIPACDMPGKLNNMNQSTSSMESTTKDLLNTTNQMKGSTDQLTSKMDDQLRKTDVVNSQTAELYDLERQGGAEEIRRKSLEGLMASHSGGDKLSQASIYFESFEFQTYTGYLQDLTQAKREALYNDALSEFFMKIEEFNANVDIVNPFSMKVIEKSPTFLPYSQTNQQACFAALAATSHMTNRKQVENIKSINTSGSQKLEVVSIYSLIMSALKREKDINSGKIPRSQVAEWEKQVLSNRDLSIKLIQTRQNVILGVFLNNVVPENRLRDEIIELYIAQDVLTPKIIGVKSILNFTMDKVRKVMASKYSWDLNLDSMNVLQIETYQEYLQAVLDTRADLKSLGLKPQIDPFMQKYLETSKVTSQRVSSSVEAAAKTKLVGLLNQIKTAN